MDADTVFKKPRIAGDFTYWLPSAYARPMRQSMGANQRYAARKLRTDRLLRQTMADLHLKPPWGQGPLLEGIGQLASRVNSPYGPPRSFPQRRWYHHDFLPSGAWEYDTLL